MLPDEDPHSLIAILFLVERERPLGGDARGLIAGGNRQLVDDRKMVVVILVSGESLRDGRGGLRRRVDPHRPEFADEYSVVKG